jgi:diguanylate cyclase (GGDEF)-like protein/PAS domain S-box-containing protein
MSSRTKTDFHSLAENSDDIICSVGMDRVLHYVSSASQAILGWQPEEMSGRGLDDFILPEDLPLLAAAFAGQNENVTIRMRKKDGSAVWMENHGHLVRNGATGEPKEHVVVMRDITDRKMQEEKVAASALTDGPTGLSNRRAFESALDMEWKRTVRGGSQISLLLFELLLSKESNGENQQQDGGDWVRAAAAAMIGTVRATDFVARYGGAEIALILPTADIASATNVAFKVRSVVESLACPKDGKPEGRWLVANIGAATGLPRHGADMKMPETLRLAADCALREARHEGQTLCAWQVGLTNLGGLIWPTEVQ